MTAAAFLRERAECLPAGFVPGNPTQLAVLALEVCDVFLEPDAEPGGTGETRSDVEIASAVVDAREEFERRSTRFARFTR